MSNKLRVGKPLGERDADGHEVDMRAWLATQHVDWAIFTADQVIRVGQDKIVLANVGWVRVPGASPLPEDTELVYVMVTRQGGGAVVEIKTIPKPKDET